MAVILVKALRRRHHQPRLCRTRRLRQLDRAPPQRRRLLGGHERRISARRNRQTAKENGSAAAPTAGLHFTPELLQKIEDKGVHLVYLTLHVGLGTFRPVSVDDVDQHEMHSEFYQLSEEAAQTLRQVKASGHRIAAVGTTSIRTLETIGNKFNGEVQAGMLVWKFLCGHKVIGFRAMFSDGLRRSEWFVVLEISALLWPLPVRLYSGAEIRWLRLFRLRCRIWHHVGRGAVRHVL